MPRLTAHHAEVIADLCAWLRDTADSRFRDVALQHGGLTSDDIAREIEAQFLSEPVSPDQVDRSRAEG